MPTPETAPAAADVLTRALPATSATSDMPDATTPVVVPQPPTSDAGGARTESSETAPVVPVPPAEGAETKAPEAEKTAEPKPDGEKKPKDGINERFSKITAEKKAALEKSAAAEEARAAADARADKLAADLQTALDAIKQVTTKPEPEDIRPNRADFDDPNKYDEALVAWSGRAAEKKVKAEAQVEFQKQRETDAQTAKENARKAEADRVAKDWSERAAEFVKTNPDFEEVIKNENVQITPVMGQAILYSDDGPKLAYHLGQHPEEAAKIAALPEAKQLMALGRLESQLNAPPKTTKAPEPIEPLRGGSNAALKTPLQDKSMSEYAAERERQLYPGRFAKR